MNEADEHSRPRSTALAEITSRFSEKASPSRFRAWSATAIILAACRREFQAVLAARGLP